ncbi:hypothetical protein FFLO_01777 [Filobasidium floriforme]|uniref:Ricin B lectin domain-containing protein n=1 Tax=Filobasidium floriforme TaxID=5210 RepID=A0A8K0JPP1_9TREE|nr:hypothetical protein FFLO_01777 [Filobasidium floriforme]
MPLFERDGEGQETCDIIEYQGHISLWDGTQPVCLTVAGENVENGSLVSVAPCEEKDGAAIQNQNWLIARGESQLLRLDGTEYCLHAGDTPANGNKVTMQRCSEIGQSPGAWFWYTELGDDHIAVTGDNQCLNRKDAIEGDENDRYQGNHPVQTWKCSGSDPNQLWITE